MASPVAAPADSAAAWREPRRPQARVLRYMTGSLTTTKPPDLYAVRPSPGALA
jgi:hypothetical protein